MLSLRQTGGKRLGFLTNTDAYRVFQDDDEIGRIDLVGQGEAEDDVSIVMREQTFEGRIHITGRGRWAHVPSRWALHSDGRELHAATWESAKTWLTVTETGMEALLLRRASFNPRIAIERVPSKDQVAEIRWLRAQIVPKPVPQRLALDSTIDMPETFELFLLLIVVMDNYRNKD